MAALLFFVSLAHAATLPTYSVLSDDQGGWPLLLQSVGFMPQPAASSRIFVLRAGSAGSPEWPTRVESGAYLILEGESSTAESFGFRPTKDNVKVASIADVHAPKLGIVWEKGLELPRYEIPAEAQIFAKERWTGAPLIAGFRRGSGAVLWVEVSPGERGYERFPYLLQALADLGLDPPFRSNRLWAFFDSSYRLRVDLDYFATRWRDAGISALQVAAWHFYDADPERDAYLKHLIAACHANGILVYAWLELPHVSEKFWDDHPQWREKTAVLQDAQLDWRKLMNLANPDCFRAAAAGVKDLIDRFDWDGVNLAELYFESLEGLSNPARFTPMNDDVRAQFRAVGGFDPIELFQTRKDAPSQRAFLDFRARLARDMQQEWLAEIESIRRDRNYLDIVLTHVDDRLDTSMRDAIGADSAQLLPLLDRTTSRSWWKIRPRSGTKRRSVMKRSPAAIARSRRVRIAWPSISISSIAIRMFIPPSSRPARNCSRWCIPRREHLRTGRDLFRKLDSCAGSGAAARCGGRRHARGDGRTEADDRFAARRGAALVRRRTG